MSTHSVDTATIPLKSYHYFQDTTTLQTPSTTILGYSMNVDHTAFPVRLSIICVHFTLRQRSTQLATHLQTADRISGTAILRTTLASSRAKNLLPI